MARGGSSAQLALASHGGCPSEGGSRRCPPTPSASHLLWMAVSWAECLPPLPPPMRLGRGCGAAGGRGVGVISSSLSLLFFSGSPSYGCEDTEGERARVESGGNL